MWISYSDSEVEKFHPICEEALNKSLSLLNLGGEYEVLHHDLVKSLEMDFVVKNINTGKHLCVIEVKRTPSDLKSLRYQIQAMSYVQESVVKSEKPYYILTNLEQALCFRFDSSRPSVVQQVLQPGLELIDSFDNCPTKEAFIDKLSLYFKEKLINFISNDYMYLETLNQFKEYIESVTGNPRYWKSYLAVFLYEYIRGSLKSSGRNELKDINLFKNDIAKICREGSRVNFEGIFGYQDNQFASEIKNIDSESLNDIFNLGLKNSSGDSIADLLHLIVSRGNEHNGEVSTDIELGRFVAQIALNLQGNLSEGEYICDPAAGSGALLSSALKVFKVEANQVVANDINERLLELLTLRIGLEYPKTISKNKSPKVTNSNIADLSQDYFKDIKVLVLNPPFVAGINCIKSKDKIYDAIRKLSSNEPVSYFGQMPLEGPFLELITQLVQPGTTIACILPKTHLVGRGKESELVRKLILNNLGVRVIFSYPGNSIFNNVTKDTCVLVGKAMMPGEDVRIISSYKNIPDLDIKSFNEVLNAKPSKKFVSMMAGIEAKTSSTKLLKQQMVDGWRDFNSEMEESIVFVNKIFYNSQYLIELNESRFKIKRGAVANNGASDLLFINSNQQFFNSIFKPNFVFKVGLRNANSDSFNLNEGDSKFFDVSLDTDDNISNIIDIYMTIVPGNKGKQDKKVKSKQELLGILEKESLYFTKENSVLIPRNLRSKGRIYLTNKEFYVSTNFFILSCDNYTEALLVSTWMTTVFYQLICEVSSKDQEGTRKMEGKDIKSTWIPRVDSIPSDLIKRLNDIKNEIDFLDLHNPYIRSVDRIWGEYIFGDRADKIMDDTSRLLSFLVDRRDKKE